MLWLVVVVWSASGYVDVPAVEQASPPTRARPAPSRRSQTTIEPGALLQVTVTNGANITGIYRVDAAGTLVLPQIGQISVNGLSLQEASDLLRDRLAESSAKTAQVRVEFDHSLQSAFVAGQVRAPGLIAMKGPLSLMKVLARAGSPTASASDVLVIIHDEFAADGTRTEETQTRVDLKDLQAGRDVLLHDGDTVFVPKAAVFYILGEVRNPGAYVLDPGMTIVEAIALAGGLTAQGSDRGIKILRSLDDKVIEIDADLARTVQPDDTIRVRGRRF